MLFLPVVLLLLSGSGFAQKTTFEDQIVATVEGDVKALAQELERLYTLRCDQDTIDRCDSNNLSECITRDDDAICNPGDLYAGSDCGDKGSCSILANFEETSLAIPLEGISGDDENPGTRHGKEVACYTQGMGSFMGEKWKADVSSWEFLGVKPAAYYFGSESTGMFREFPSRQWTSCHGYDPRVRPWYMAASTGPKKIVFVLDTNDNVSTSNGDLETMIASVNEMVGKLSFMDQIAIVTTTGQDDNVTAQQRSKVSLNELLSVSSELKSDLKAEIELLKFSGKSDYSSAFNLAYDLLESSEGCNNAVVFFSNTEIEDSTERGLVVDSIGERTTQSQDALGKKIIFFSFVLGEGSTVFASELACSIEMGVSASIPTADSASMTNELFAKVFAAAIANNPDFVAWTAPYSYDISQDEVVFGTTIAAPVYDRSGEHPVFLGVAGIDFALEQLDEAHELFRNEDSEESINRVVALASQNNCPMIDVPACLIESFRSCPNTNCTEKLQVEESYCDDSIVFPTNFWKNVDYKGVPKVERACCVIDAENTPADTCPPTQNTNDQSDEEVEATSWAAAASVASLLFSLIVVLIN